MGYESFSLSEVIPAAPERIYAAWMNSDEHSAFTGDRAEIEPFVGGKHSAFAGYAVGSTVELSPGHRIVQTWRATDFPPGSPDSRVEVTLETTVGGTMVTILHTEIPAGRSDVYRDSWLKYYLEPLKEYFEKVPRQKHNGVPTVAPVKAAAKKAKAPAKRARVKVKVKTKTKAKPKPKKKAPAKKKVAAKKSRSRTRTATRTRTKKKASAKRSR